ncbi:MAG: NAD-dependent epimerase/dehydratase family protein [Acidobacteriota bacterium]|nr:MAG: NAD-dependent epimerase/dehydratase family protein [Acidobacteriota bacterium]
MTEAGKPKVLVTGASGAVGRVLVEELARSGVSVRAEVRDPASVSFPEQVEVIVGDLRDEEVVRRAVEGVTTIYHFAAKLHINDPADDLRREYEEVNVGSTRSLIELSECERFIFASTINVYGAGGPFDELSPADPSGPYAETKAEAERLVLDHPGGTVLRFAAVYGKGMKGNFPKLVSAIRKGMFAYVGAGKNRRTLVYERDAVRAAILCANDERSNGKIYNVTDGEVHTLEEIVVAISKALGKKPPSIHLPESLARAAFAGGDVFLKIAGKEMRLTPLIEKINEDIAVDGSLIREELGFEPEFGLEEGWEEVLSVD